MLNFFAFMQIERDERIRIPCNNHCISPIYTNVNRRKNPKNTIGQRSDIRSSKCQFALPFPITLFLPYLFIYFVKNIELKMN